MSTLIRVGLISAALSLVSCSGAFKGHSPIPGNANTIEQIYNQHQANTNPIFQQPAPAPASDTELWGYTRQVNNELSVHFPRLPNPTIILYVFPHLSLEGNPVPGYSTVFQMYEKVEYALPGELLMQ